MHWRARLSSGEAKTGNRPAKGKRQIRDLSLESTSVGIRPRGAGSQTTVQKRPHFTSGQSDEYE